MEESKFFNFEKAPYLELDDYKAPKGINSYFVPMDDGIRLKGQFYYNKVIMNLLKNIMKLFRNF